MGHWLAECSKGVAQSDIVAACIGADATMSGAYIQSIVTAVAAVIALVAAYLAYRGATASIRYEENIRKGVVKAYAHRLFGALYRVEQQLIGPFSAGNNDDVRLTYRPVPMPA